MRLNLSTLTWNLATLTFQMHRGHTCSDKVWRSPFTWQVYSIPSTGQLRTLDSEMIKIIFHHPNIHYSSLWYFHWLIGIVNTQAKFQERELDFLGVYQWNFHVAQNISLSLEQYRHQKHIFWKHVFESMADTKTDFFSWFHYFSYSRLLVGQRVLPATIGFYA